MRFNKNCSGSNRFPAARLTVFVLAFAAAGVFLFRAGSSGSVRLAIGGASSLQKGAEEYLRQTARILGSRFNEPFYSAAVKRQMRRFADWPPRTDVGSRDCFTDLAAEDDPDLSEALIFLDEFAAAEPELSIDRFSAEKNPLDSLVERIAPFSVPPSPLPKTFLWRSAEIPLSIEFLFLFSLVSFLASILIPTSPFAAAVGMPEAIEEWFVRLALRLGVFHAIPAIGHFEVPKGFLFSFGHTPLEDKKITVLLR